MNYNRINNITGWLVFAIAFVAYLMTMAPTSSYWDCGEFISCANELEAPHPPGPPVFLLIGRIFSMFALGNMENVAYWVNMVSALSSAFTVLFTFWIITILGKKLLEKTSNNLLQTETILLMFAGTVGALACAFSDSFWFNAVEAEVYAMSSLCTALVIWLMLKWEARSDEPDHLRWIVFIAYIVGLSISVHLLNLLAIPGLALVYYFKKYNFSWLGLFATLGISVALLGFVQIGIIQWSMEIIMKIEIPLVGKVKADGSMYSSGMGFPQGSGLFLFSIILAALLGFGIYYSHKIKNGWLNTGMVSYVVILVGYSTYMIIALRANAGVPINENDPGNLPSMLSYMRREQYGDTKLLKGPLYNVNPSDPKNGVKVIEKEDYIVKLKEPYWFPIEDGAYSTKEGTKFTVKSGKAQGLNQLSVNSQLEDGTPIRINGTTKLLEWEIVSDKYVWDGSKRDYKYPSNVEVFFPRMHSSSHYSKDAHNYGYEHFVKKKGKEGDPYDDKPSSSENMKFFFLYQVAHMYWRYFGWNFIGRQSDIQDDGVEAGFFKSGMPEFMKKDPSKNHYYALPLLLGVLGLAWQLVRKTKDAMVIVTLFLFTGVMIVVYLNQTPTQPRERDYSYVGSFQTFCIWIGLGVIALYEMLRTYLKNATVYLSGGLCLLLVPTIMLKENWNDHSRHFQYVPPDSAYNLLMSCKRNALIFTNGDNDTFPLWYIQEVEGVRTDVRVVNLSLLNTDWYIDQMRMQSNESAPLPISLKEIDYRGERGQMVPWKEGKSLELPSNSQKLIEYGVVAPEDIGLVENPLRWTPSHRGSSANAYLLKQDYLIVNILQTNAANNWERPIYFSSTIPRSSYLGLEAYFQGEGLAYRVVPYKKQNIDPYPVGFLDLDRSYTLLKDTFKYRELNNPNLYLDEHIRRTIIGNLNNTYYRVISNYTELAKKKEELNGQYKNAIDALTKSGGNKATIDSLSRTISANEKQIPELREKAKNLLIFREEKMPYKLIEVDPVLHAFFGQGFYDVGMKEQAFEYYNYVASHTLETFEYYKSSKQDSKIAYRDISAVEIATRNLITSGEVETAKGYANRLFKVTGDARHQQLISLAESKTPPPPENQPVPADCTKP